MAIAFHRVNELEFALLVWEYWYLSLRNKILDSGTGDRFRMECKAFKPENLRKAQLNAQGKTFEQVCRGWTTPLKWQGPVMQQTHEAVDAFGVGLLSWQISGRRVFDITAESVHGVLAAGDDFLDTPMDSVPWPGRTFFVRAPESLSAVNPGRCAFLFSREELNPMFGSSGAGATIVSLKTPPSEHPFYAFMANETKRRLHGARLRNGQYHSALHTLRDIVEGKIPAELTESPRHAPYVISALATPGTIARELIAKGTGSERGAMQYDFVRALRLALGITAILARRNARRKGISTAVPVVPKVEEPRTLETITSTDDVCVVTLEDVKEACEPDEPPIPRDGVKGWEMPYHTVGPYLRRRPGESKDILPSVKVKGRTVHPEKKPEGVEGLDPGKRTVVV